jgi:hypothetical protein
MKKIEFICSDIEIDKIVDPPKPSKFFIPEWYKKSSSYVTDDNSPIHYDGKVNHTFKKCIPILDSMTSGYMFGLPSDVYALNPEKYSKIRLSWGGFPIEIISSKHAPEQLKKYPTTGNFQELFRWKFWWQIKTPPGYSCLFLHPLHRNDLPFITMSGIVDTDTYNAPIEFPFFLNNSFEGKINKGTPVVQIIPFKRDSWKSVSRGFSENVNINIMKNFSIIGDMYKKTFWKNKEYN